MSVDLVHSQVGEALVRIIVSSLPDNTEADADTDKKYLYLCETCLKRGWCREWMSRCPKCRQTRQ